MSESLADRNWWHHHLVQFQYIDFMSESRSIFLVPKLITSVSPNGVSDRIFGRIDNIDDLYPLYP
jgi:hypothetical protein